MAANKWETGMANIEELEKRLNLLEGENAVRRLQYAYGFYRQMPLRRDVDLFSEDRRSPFMGGIYKGKAGVPASLCRSLPQEFHK